MVADLWTYPDYTHALEARLARINQLNDDINTNRNQHAQAVKAFEDATEARSADAVESARRQADQLDDDLTMIQLEVTNLTSFITVTGANSGPRSGVTQVAGDGRTVISTD